MANASEYVFISYKSEDVDKAKKIQQYLEKEGYKCWRAPESLRNGGTRDFGNEIFEAIRNSACLLFVLSNRSLCSDWVRNEVGYALEKCQKPIISYVIDKIPAARYDSDELVISLSLQQQILNKDLSNDLSDILPCIKNWITPCGQSDVLATPSAHDIFISYSRKNKDMVLPIKEEIERTLGLRCWIDLSDIPCGSENFKRKVIPGIRQTRIAFLFFLSAESQASEYAIKEVGFASKRANKRVILIRFNDDDMTDDFYFDFQNADIIDWRAPEQKEKLLHDLRIWSDQARLPVKNDCSVGMGGSNEEVKSYGRIGLPSQENMDTVRDKFAHFLYAEKGWSEFTALDFKTTNDCLIGFMVKDSRKAPVRLMWLQCSDICDLIDIGENDYLSMAERIFSNSPIPSGCCVSDAWNSLAKAFMPALLFAYDIRGLIYESEKKQILIPLLNANPLSYKGRADVCVRKFSDKDCVCVIFDESRLSQLIGKNRADCSELAIGWIKGVV